MNIWLYWENKKGRTMPEYLKLCYENICKHKGTFDKVILLNEKTVHEYVKLRNDLSEIEEIAHKVDYIRTRILSKYGGLWLDIDIIILKNLSIVRDLLNKYEFVGFGDKPHSPRLPFFACRPDSKIVKLWMEKQEEIVEIKKSFHWTEIGADILWNLPDDIYDDSYYQYRYEIISPIPWNEHEKLFDTCELEEYISENTMTVLLFNKIIGKQMSNNREELLNGNKIINKLFRKYLGENDERKN